MSYTDQEVTAIIDAAPLTFESAQVLANKLGKTHRSVISKAKQLGVEYQPKVAPKKRPSGVTKAELVATISEKVGVDLTGLEMAKASALEALLKAL